MSLAEALILGNKKLRGECDLSWAQIGKAIGLTADNMEKLTIKYIKGENKKTVLMETSTRKKILIFSDCHVPDHKRDLILNIIKQHGNVDMIIIAGDMIDCKAVSAWHDEHITILDYEMQEAYKLLKEIRALTKAKIMLVKGNHEARVNTEYAKNAKRMGSLAETEILYKLAYGFTIKTKQDVRLEYEAIENVDYCDARTFCIGDLLVNHPSTFRKDYLKTVSIMYSERFKQKYPNAKVFIIGHTHQLGMCFAEDGKVLMESGCTCEPASYAEKDDKPFKIQQYGAITLEMENDQVDINSIKLHYYGYDTLDNEDIDIHEEL